MQRLANRFGYDCRGFVGAGTLTQSAGAIDLGTSATLTAGTVEIDGGTLLADGPGALLTASLVYNTSASSSYPGVLAGARKTLIEISPAALLVLRGSARLPTAARLQRGGAGACGRRPSRRGKDRSARAFAVTHRI